MSSEIETNCRHCFEHEMEYIKIYMRAAKDTFSAQILLDSLLTHREVASVPLSNLAGCPCTLRGCNFSDAGESFLVPWTAQTPRLSQVKRHLNDLRIKGEALVCLVLKLSLYLSQRTRNWWPKHNTAAPNVLIGSQLNCSVCLSTRSAT